MHGVKSTPFAATAASRVAHELRERIYQGRLRPGSPLREIALAAELEVSRRTIREALIRLSGERLVTHERNRGATVRVLDDTDVIDLYEVRRTLELQGARHATSASAQARGSLTERFSQLCEAADSGASRAIVEADLAFHGAVVELSGSPRLSSFYAQVSPEMEMALTLIRDREHGHGWSAEAVIGDHRTIHDALIAGDVIEAQRALFAHIEFNQGFLLELLAEAQGSPDTHHR